MTDLDILYSLHEAAIVLCDYFIATSKGTKYHVTKENDGTKWVCYENGDTNKSIGLMSCELADPVIPNKTYKHTEAMDILDRTGKPVKSLVSNRIFRKEGIYYTADYSIYHTFSDLERKGEWVIVYDEQ